MPKATFAQIRPQKTEFIELPDPKSVLEIQLRNFICLTEGESITIRFANKDFLIDIIKLQPESQYKTGIIIDTDLVIDFATPLDYKEPEKKHHEIKPKESTNSNNDPFTGKVTRIDGKRLSTNDV